MKIVLKEDAKPYSVAAPRRIPIPLLPRVEEELRRMEENSIIERVYTTLDAASGFWQIALDEESSKLTTFITPKGRYCFKRLPFGITSAPEIFQRKMQEPLQDHEGTVV